MTIHTKELIDAVSVIADNHNIRVTVKSSLQASAVVAGFTFVGAVVRLRHMVKFLWFSWSSSFLDYGSTRDSDWCYSRWTLLIQSLQRFVPLTGFDLRHWPFITFCRKLQISCCNTQRWFDCCTAGKVLQAHRRCLQGFQSAGHHHVHPIAYVERATSKNCYRKGCGIPDQWDAHANHRLNVVVAC